MADAITTFTMQGEVRPPWHRFLDELAPLRPELFRLCCGLTGSVWDGEDLEQDVLARVFAHLGRINRDLTDPRTYFVRTATHMWLERLRPARLEPSFAEGAAPEPATDVDPQRVDVRATPNSLFLRLPPLERAAVLLADGLNFSLDAIGGLLKSTPAEATSALRRGRARLQRATPQEALASTTPREVVDRFVAALSTSDFEAIRALCLPDVTVDMVGGNVMEGYETGKVAIEHAHFVMPARGFGEHPHWRTELHEGEPIAIGFRTLDGVEGLNEIWRFEMGAAGVARLRLYCFSPDVLAAVARDLGVPALKRPYRSP